jgi:hypothetical protein
LLSTLLVQEVFPLEYALIFTASRNEVRYIFDEADISDVRGVPDVLLTPGLGHRVRVLEEFDLAEVVGSCANDAVRASINSVDIGTVREGSENALNWPS